MKIAKLGKRGVITRKVWLVRQVGRVGNRVLDEGGIGFLHNKELLLEIGFSIDLYL